MKEDRKVSFRLTEDQYNLARRRLFGDDLNWQTMLTALVNAYITGYVSVTKAGRFVLSPPTSKVPVIEVDTGEDLVEVEPDWRVSGERPQVGSPQQRPRKLRQWGTSDLAIYLREQTGRRISIQHLRKLLSTMNLPKGDNGRWSFSGPEDETIQRIIKAIEEGVYDALIREGVQQARQRSKEITKNLESYWQSVESTEMQRRLNHLKRLRELEG